MSLAVLDLQPCEPSSRELMDRALEPHVLLGMPHLTPNGLSEPWLMKELGHRHWLMLARHLGMEDADFRTADGEEAYAAIRATSLHNARLELARANDVLTIRSMLSPISRTQVATRHRLLIHGSSVGEVELISAFVWRSRAGDNHAIARIPLPAAAPHVQYEENALAETAAALRSGQLPTHFGLPLSSDRVLRSFEFQPDPSLEFNGAGLFYFAEFQALVNRAIRRWFRDPSAAIARRDVFFSGNIRSGETVIVELIGLAENRMTSWCRLRREDGQVIGKIFEEWRQPRQFVEASPTAHHSV